MTSFPQHLSTLNLQALRRGFVMLIAAMLVWLGMSTQARADGSDQLSNGGTIWYNASTGIVENTVTPFGGNTSFPIESVWLYKIGASGYYQGFTPNQTGLTLNIWQAGYIPNMIVVRCSRRQGCSGMLESNNVSITPPSCPTISIYPNPLPNALQGAYYGVETITPSGGTAPYSWSVVSGSLPPGIVYNWVGDSLEISGVPNTAGSFTVTFKATDATGICNGTQAYTINVVNTNITISDRLWNDLDKDGIQDAGEPGLPNRTVYLLNTTGVAVYNSTVTDASGYYQINYITGGSYRVGIDVDDTVRLSPANAAGSNDTNDSDFTTTIGTFWVTDIINISASTSDLDGGLYYGEDFGDLPSPYPTTGTLGASHTRHIGLRLGANYDFETAGQPNATATGDDALGTPDDEDGISTFPAFTAGATATVSVSVLNSTGVARRLHSFFDWNADGDFVDAGESIAAVVVNHLNSQQTISVSVPVPAGTASGQKGARFRLSDQTTLAATGASTIGEVEDYFVTVACPAVTVSGPGTFPNGLVGTAYPAQTFTASGGTAPYTWSMSPTIPGMSISSAGVLSGTPTAGGTYNVTITATGANNCSGTRAITIIINACPSAITLLAGETYTLTANGVVSAFWLVNTGSGAVPISGANGLTYVVSVPGIYTWIGLDALGCVVEGCCPMTFTGSVDYGDLADTSSGTGTGNYQTLLANGGAVHWTTNSTLRLGAAADADANGQPNATATGDDIAGTTPDDEDSISAMPTFARGQAFSIPVSYFNSIAILPYLYGFIDWNQDGDFNDAGEALTPVGLGQAALQQSVNLTGTVPANAVLGTTGARFRFTTATGVLATGVAPNGEVEDYMITITCPTITVNPATLTNPIQGFAYSTSLSAAGGSSPYTFAITSGSLPTGLAMTSAGVISGTATSSGASPFTVTATDANGCTGSQAYTLTPVVTDFGDWNGAGAATTTTTSTRNTSLRLGLTVDAETSVVPNATATTDDTTNTGSADDEDGVTALPATLTKGTNGTLTLSVFNNTGANAFLHTWIDFNGDGTFNDTVMTTTNGERLEAVRTIATSATAQTINLTVNAPAWAVVGANRGVRVRLTSLNTTLPTGASGSGEIEDYVTAIACPTITVNPLTLPNPVVNSSYSTTVSATGGTGTYTFAVTSGSLPSGLTLTGSSGVISGVNTATTAATFTITATDSLGCSGSRPYTLTPVLSDFGDWSGAGAATTTAFATYNANLRLGAAFDAEASVTANATATTDDTTNTGSVDDEESASVPATMMQGVSVTLPVSVFNNTGAGRFLHAWIDFNNDGTFNDTVVTSGGERLEAARTVNTAATATTQNITFTVPAAASVGTGRGVRIRVSDSSTTLPTTAGGAGEIEDYVVQIVDGTDLGDFSGFGAASSIFNSTIKMGVNAADAEVSLTANATANADDTTGIDDEDGVTQSILRANQAGTITVNVTNTSAAAAFLNVWADWNLNNIADAGEQVATNISIAAATSNFNQVLNVTPPITTATGNVPLRARFTAATGATFTGAFSTGEVEDHLIAITAPNQDFGDFSGFAQATSVANSTLKLGLNAADAEANLIGNTSANVDDTTGTDDEDGVTHSALRANQAGTITVNVTNTSAAAAFLNVWVDWNLNNSVDAGEQIATNTSIAAATSNFNQVLNVTVPATTVTGTVPLRARITNTATPGFSNTFPGTTLGEVEDHLLTITAPNRDHGDLADTTAGTAAGNYRTLLSDNGPYHTQNAALGLGALWDAEANGLQSSAADGDDLNTSDDEDAITATLPTLIPGNAASFTVNLRNTTGAAALLNVWIDFNNNGDFEDAGEKVMNGQSIANAATSQLVSFTTPAAAKIATVGVRIRLTQTAGLTSVGDGGVGEVEDYRIGIDCPVITVNPPTVADGNVGFAWTQTFTQTGSPTTPISWSVTSGTVPIGLSLVASTGVLSGTPTTAGTYSFRITATDANNCTGFRDYTVNIRNRDFGDWSGFGGSASTDVNGTIKLGALIDNEAGITPNTSANLDDTTGSDDEDGVTQSALRSGQAGTITVNVTNSSGAAAYLNVWIDWNNNTLFDAGEQIATNTLVATGTLAINQVINVTVPTTSPTANIGLRARLTSIQNPVINGLSGIGEVEDHLISITAPNQDFGDFSGFAQATSVANSSIKLGVNAADTEVSLTANATANADDTTGIDDEDSVTQSTLRANQAGTITVNVTNTSAAAAFLNVWADWNLNNSVDGGEHIASNISIAAATSNFNQVLNVTPPTGTATGTVPLRARFTNTATPGFSNAFPGTTLGEVEDHLLTITAPNLDFGDFSGFAQATSVANSTIKLGVNAADAEDIITATALANADDTTGIDDEDGVTQSTLRANQAGTITVNVTNTSATAAFLNVWADWNLNNSVDAGEQIASNISIAAATSNFNQVLNVTPPASTITGNVPLRARFTNTATPGFSNTFPGTTIGEVEDHLIVITAPNQDFGDFSGFAQATSVANSTIKLGVNAADAEAIITANTTANADDTSGIDDEDGVTQSTLRANQAGTITANVTNTSAAAAFLNVWADWNLNNAVDAGEQIATNISIAAATSNFNQVLNVTPPVTTATGTVPLRARITNTATPGFTNTFPGTTLGEVEDHLIVITAPDRDFGDWSGAGAATTSAFATGNANLRLGAAFDAEASVAPNATANTDDVTGSDDEEAATVPATMMQGVSVTLPVSVFNNTGAGRFLHAWIDFNNDGTFNDMVVTSGGERLEAVRTVATAAAAATQNITFTVPVAASVGTGRGVRIRVSDSSTTLPTTAGGAGEIEDYVVQIVDGTDLGDFSGFGAASSIFNSTIKMGVNAADAEVSLVANTTANTDDTTGIDDEDGVTQGTLRAGQAGTITVNVTNTSAAAAFLNIWADWNLNNIADAGEQIATNISIAAATSNFNQVLNVTPPVTTATGTVPLRARFTAVTGATFTGAFSTGEVEDHLITITAPDREFADWSHATNPSGAATTTTYSMMNTNLRLGATVDAEAAVTASAAATTDDTTNTGSADDEDGVTMPATIMQSIVVTLPVSVFNNTGVSQYLHAWIDFNNDGVFSDTVVTSGGERLEAVRTVVTGAAAVTQNIVFTVPSAASVGAARGARFRVSDSAAATPTSVGGQGEIEDHVVQILQAADYGDYSAFISAGFNASTLVNSTLKLGTAVTDAELTSAGNAAANLDDAGGLTPDDEDGVTFGAATQGQPLTITVRPHNMSGAVGYLNLWVDWNANNIVDAGEMITTNQSIATGTDAAVAVPLTFTPTVPATALGFVGVRARMSNVSAPAGTGLVGSGEIEDHRINVIAAVTDLGDSNAFPAASSSSSTTIFMGTNPTDIEVTLTANATADADDTTSTDDEDAVTHGVLRANQSGAITVRVNNTSGAVAYLNAWVDWNKNNTVDAGEQVAANVNVATGLTAFDQVLNVTPPAATLVGTVPARFRFNNGAATTVGGAYGNGEIEDHLLTISAPNMDFGDWSGAGAATTTTNSTLNSNLRLGATVDAEATVVPNATATTDDVTNTGSADDEDGATTLPATITKGTNSTITLSVFNNTGANAFLHSWIDLNGDGTFNDGVVSASPGERLEAVRTIATSATAQTVNITYTVPSWAVVGANRGVRFRLTNLNTTTPTGTSGSGEIEDNITTVACPVITVNPATLTNPIQGNTYSATITATGGNGAYTYAVTSGSVPAGLTLSTAGVLSGNTTASTAATFTVTATDAFGCTGSQAYTLTPVITDFGDWNGAGAATTTTTSTRNANLRLGATVDAETAVAPNAAATADDTSNTGSADDEDGATTLPATITKGTNSTITLSVFNNSGANAFLHSWIDLNGDGTFNDGVVSTSPGERLEAVRTIATSATAQTVNITYTVPSWAVVGANRGVRFRLTNLNTTTPTGASGAGEIEDYVTTVACPAITITQSALTAYISTAYSQTLTATGGMAPYTNWTVTTGTLPVGLTLSSAGVLSGTPSAIGSSTVTISTTDSFGCPASGSLTINVKGMTVGNQVWQDNNNNGSFDAGEPGVSGAQVILMNPGADNVIGGAVADVQVGSLITTPASGLYSFANLPPGNYYVRVIAPSYLTHTSGTPATTDNNVNNNNDGAQPGGVGTELRSTIINLAPGAESITDGDADNDTNLTLDFGLWAPLGVGNVVFIDLNGDGNLDVNEGLEGVLVQIFPQGAAVTSTPAGAAVTDDKGRYFIDGLNPGNYFLHIPASQFATGSPLVGMFPMNSVVAGDDNVGQDLIAAATPATTGASTAVFTLSPGGQPAGASEPGFEGFVDDAFIDSNIDFTRDLGLRSASGTGFPLSIRERTLLERTAMPAAETEPQTELVTFASWSESHGDAEDGDLYPNLLEYALDTDPADGRSGAGSFRLETNATTGTADAVFTRPANGRADIRYEVEVSVDGTRWTKLASTPQLSIGADGRQIVRHNAVDGSNVFAGEARGLVRLKVSLDANLDGSAEDAAITPINMFSRETFTSGTQRTFSMPLANIELFAGDVSSSGKVITLPQTVVLPESKELYVQDLVSGQIYEVDEKASVMPKLTLTSTPDSALSRMALRVHHRLSSLLPEDLFSSGNSAETADRVLSFDPETNNFSIAHLSSKGWMRDEVDVSDSIIAPLSAVLVHTRGEEVSVLLTGQVGPQISIKPATSTRLLGTSSIVAESADRLGVNTTKGYRSATEPAEAARLRLWKADADSADTGYDQLYLNSNGWQRQDDSTGADLSAERLLQPFRGFFLVP